MCAGGQPWGGRRQWGDTGAGYQRGVRHAASTGATARSQVWVWAQHLVAL